MAVSVFPLRVLVLLAVCGARAALAFSACRLGGVWAPCSHSRVLLLVVLIFVPLTERRGLMHISGVASVVFSCAHRIGHVDESALLSRPTLEAAARYGLGKDRRRFGSGSGRGETICGRCPPRGSFGSWIFGVVCVARLGSSRK